MSTKVSTFSAQGIPQRKRKLREGHMRLSNILAPSTATTSRFYRVVDGISSLADPVARDFAWRAWKVYCTYLVRRAIEAGYLKRLPCEVCTARRAQAHHPDYREPFTVRWLCPKHHAAADREARLR